MRWKGLRALLGDEHPATRAARGRLFALTDRIVELAGPVTPEAIGWMRQTGDYAGIWNRHHRRARLS